MARILIIEDDALIARMYEAAFRFEKFEVDVAHNGKDGLEKLKKNRPSLILLDIMMPVMNGLEVLKQIKDDPRYKGIPVVMLTNLFGSKDIEEALSLGAVKYIVKSKYKPKEVVAQIKEILAGYTRNEVPQTKS